MNTITRYILFLSLIFLLQDMYSQSRASSRASLDSVTAVSERNLAYEIMKLAVQNRQKNSPFNSKSFKCILYNKTYFTSPIIHDTLFSLLQQQNEDSLSKQQKKELGYYNFFTRQHLFITESVVEKLFKHPILEYERIIASKTSGVEDPIFSILLTKTQSFSFYESDFITIAQAKYVNPVSKTAIHGYEFTIIDARYVGKDTIFVISFQPKKQAIFKGLEGILYIHSDQYAIQQVEAEPFDKSSNLSIKISHSYQKQESGNWFPKEINAELSIPNLVKGCPLTGYSNTVIENIEIDIPLKNKDFGILDVEDDIKSLRASNYLLQKYRSRPIDMKEEMTYFILDSLGKEVKVDRVLFFLQTALLGSIPVGPVDIDIKSIVRFNSYEGFRFGLGLYTNRRLMRYLRFGGYFGFGLKDNSWKWGAKADVFLNRSREFVLKLQYASDLIESGRAEIFDRAYTILSGEFYRNWLLSKFDKSNLYSATLEMRLTRFLRGMVSTNYRQNETAFTYGFEMPVPADGEFSSYHYKSFEIRAGLRFAFKETYFKAGDLYFLERSPYPIVTFQYTRGIKNVFQSSFAYNKYDIKVYHKQSYKRMGYSEIWLKAGITDANLPYSLLYSSAGGYDIVGFYGKEQFGAMRPNEFMSSAYVTLFLYHNFGKMTDNKKFSPHIVLCQNIGFGWLNNRENHYGVDFKTMEKGYFETGLVLEDLVKIKGLLSFGIGAFYRYGRYAYVKEIDNFAFKIDFRIPIQN